MKTPLFTKENAPGNTNELARALSKRPGYETLTVLQAEKTILEVTMLIRESLAAQGKDGRITLHQFGNFAVTDISARQGRNPKTGEPVQIEASKRVHFKPSLHVKNAVNGVETPAGAVDTETGDTSSETKPPKAAKAPKAPKTAETATPPALETATPPAAVGEAPNLNF